MLKVVQCSVSLFLSVLPFFFFSILTIACSLIAVVFLLNPGSVTIPIILHLSSFLLLCVTLAYVLSFPLFFQNVAVILENPVQGHAAVMYHM